jgi:hypothetical protein
MKILQFPVQKAFQLAASAVPTKTIWFLWDILYVYERNRVCFGDMHVVNTQFFQFLHIR